VVSFTPQGKSPRYQLDRRLGGPQSRSGDGGEENSQHLPELEPPIFQPIAQRYATEQNMTQITRQEFSLLMYIAMLQSSTRFQFLLHAYSIKVFMHFVDGQA
jgi:hypothetical protein